MSKTAIIQAQQRWEYLCLPRKSEVYLTNELNLLGQDGWELVTTQLARDSKGATCWIAFLKRPCGSGQPAAAGTTAATATQQPAGQKEPEEGQPAGFDLSGDVFEFKKGE